MYFLFLVYAGGTFNALDSIYTVNRVHLLPNLVLKVFKKSLLQILEWVLFFLWTAAAAMKIFIRSPNFTSLVF